MHPNAEQVITVCFCLGIRAKMVNKIEMYQVKGQKLVLRFCS